ncbi:MAG TPA: hypothetical protein VMO26_13905 [Vicinamibacterales bacterium]|nr:hypothetical protein [Vicinamibacterales bacterium]
MTSSVAFNKSLQEKALGSHTAIAEPRGVVCFGTRANGIAVVWNPHNAEFSRENPPRWLRQHPVSRSILL